MRRYAPMYEGDGFLRPDAALGEAATTAFKKPVSAPDFVRGNIQTKAANETALDLYAIEQIARRQRSAELGRMLKAAYTAVVDWLERTDEHERDNFFASASDLADLEQRQRHWERTGCAHYH